MVMLFSSPYIILYSYLRKTSHRLTVAMNLHQHVKFFLKTFALIMHYLKSTKQLAFNDKVMCAVLKYKRSI